MAQDHNGSVLAATATEDTMECRSPDDVAEALAIQKLRDEATIVRAANELAAKLDHLLDEVPC